MTAAKQIHVKLPAALHRQVKVWAARRGTTINEATVAALRILVAPKETR